MTYYPQNEREERMAEDAEREAIARWEENNQRKWTVCEFCRKPIVGMPYGTGRGAHDRCGDGPKA